MENANRYSPPVGESRFIVPTSDATYTFFKIRQALEHYNNIIALHLLREIRNNVNTRPKKSRNFYALPAAMLHFVAKAKCPLYEFYVQSMCDKKEVTIRAIR